VLLGNVSWRPGNVMDKRIVLMGIFFSFRLNWECWDAN